MVDCPQLFLNRFSEMIETILPDLMSFGRLGPVLTPQAAKNPEKQVKKLLAKFGEFKTLFDKAI